MTSRGQCPRGVLVNVQEYGCFSIFRRAYDVTQTMSKGGGCLWGVFQFSGGRMTSRRQCPRGAGVLVKSPLQEILYPRLLSV